MAVTEPQLRKILKEYKDDVEDYMDRDQRFDLAFDLALYQLPEETYVGDIRDAAYSVLELAGTPYHPNPLPSWHMEDRESYEGLVARVCGCSAKTAARIVEAYPSGSGLSSATAPRLRHLGATANQARRLEAAFSLCHLVEERAHTRHATIRKPTDVEDYLRAHLSHLDEENFVAIYLDARQRVIDSRIIARGSLSQVEVHPRELFVDGVRLRAHSIILAHNHPSGSADPSDADIEITKRMADTGRVLGIPVLDHIVVSRDYRGEPVAVSLASLGMIPTA